MQARHSAVSVTVLPAHGAARYDPAAHDVAWHAAQVPSLPGPHPRTYWPVPQSVRQTEQCDRSDRMAARAERAAAGPSGATEEAVPPGHASSRSGAHVVGVFVDFACLYQTPRTAAQDAAFGAALKVMANGYASALGVTVAPHHRRRRRGGAGAGDAGGEQHAGGGRRRRRRGAHRAVARRRQPRAADGAAADAEAWVSFRK